MQGSAYMVGFGRQPTTSALEPTTYSDFRPLLESVGARLASRALATLELFGLLLIDRTGVRYRASATPTTGLYVHVHVQLACTVRLYCNALQS